MKVRKANAGDISALCEMLGLLFDQEVEFSANPENQKKGLAHIIQDSSRGVILIVEINQRIIGMVNLLFTISTFRGGKVAILEDMIVHPDQRGRGVGSLLLRSAISEAEECGCARITLLTDRENLPAHKFYEKHGFSKSPMIPMRISLNLAG